MLMLHTTHDNLNKIDATRYQNCNQTTTASINFTWPLPSPYPARVEDTERKSMNFEPITIDESVAMSSNHVPKGMIASSNVSIAELLTGLNELKI